MGIWPSHEALDSSFAWRICHLILAQLKPGSNLPEAVYQGFHWGGYIPQSIHALCHLLCTQKKSLDLGLKWQTQLAIRCAAFLFSDLAIAWSRARSSRTFFCTTACRGDMLISHSRYGSFQKLGDPNIDPNISYLSWGLAERQPNFRKPPYVLISCVNEEAPCSGPCRSLEHREGKQLWAHARLFVFKQVPLTPCNEDIAGCLMFI